MYACMHVYIRVRACVCVRVCVCEFMYAVCQSSYGVHMFITLKSYSRYVRTSPVLLEVCSYRTRVVACKCSNDVSTHFDHFQCLLMYLQLTNAIITTCKFSCIFISHLTFANKVHVLRTHVVNTGLRALCKVYIHCLYSYPLIQ